MAKALARCAFAASIVGVQSESRPAATLTQSAEAVLVKLDWSMSMTQLREKIQAVVAQGENPMGVKAWIDTQLLPQVRQTAQELQGEADAAEKAVNDCRNFMWSAEKEASHRQSILEKDESDKFACIGEEHRLHHAEEETCGEMKFIADQAVKSPPQSLTTMTNKTPEEVEVLVRESQQFFADFYPRLVERQSGCAQAQQAAENQHATCIADEEIIEQFYCTMKFGRDNACDEYEACYAEQTTAFDKAMADVKSLEAHTKERFKKLTCFSDEGEESTGKCQTDTVSVAHLAVSYPLKPQKQTCIKLMKTRRSYDDVVCKDGSVVPHGDHPGDASSTSSTDSNGTQAPAGSNSTTN